MQKLTKIILLTSLEFLIVVLFLNVYDKYTVFVATFFPPLFAVTLYALVFTILNIENPNSRKHHAIFALLLASVALFSTSIGFHYASNDINNFFENFPELQELNNRLYFLDELFSHWLSLAGLIGIFVAVILWIIIKSRKSQEQAEVKESRVVDLFLISFSGVLLGTTAAFGAIESNLLKQGLIFMFFIVPFVLFKYKNYRIKQNSRDAILFFIIFVTSYISVSLIYLIAKNTKFAPSLFN